MRGLVSSFLVLATLLAPSSAGPVATINHVEGRSIAITVSSPAGTVIGKEGLLTQTETFNGIPYAQPPVGNLRLRPPVRLTTPLVNFDAGPAAAACPQMMADSSSNDFVQQVVTTVTETPIFKRALNVQEDCLTLNVIRPKGTKAGDKLPVLFWIYGGGFELGWSSMYDASGFVNNVAQKGKPFVFVAVNYRLGGWGFLPGKEVKEAGVGNLGLLDQRMGLQWVADNIAAFGGDPDKVTIWGESAGSMSVWSHMSMYDGNYLYNNKPLFRAGIMNSWSIFRTAPIDADRGQAVYDAVVARAGCQGPNSLDCLRALPYDKFTAAATSVPSMVGYSSLALSYVPRPDGTILTDSATALLRDGKYAAVPFIIGNQEDEGTLFSLFQANTTGSTENLVDYLKDQFYHQATKDSIKELVDTYPNNIVAGSPFRTTIFNEIYPGFKRLSAIIGDIVFIMPRRIHLNLHTALRPSVPCWSYISSYAYGTPILGTFHATDIVQVFFGILPNYASNGVQSYYANFVYNMDPNNYSGGTGTGTRVNDVWKPWTQANKVSKQFYALWFQDLADNFRDASYKAFYKYTDAGFEI